MISVMEKEKLVYVLNRDAAVNLTISSPLEAHKPHVILFIMLLASMLVLRTPCSSHCRSTTWNLTRIPLMRPSIMLQRCVGHITKSSRLILVILLQILTYYKLDLGLNHVVHRWSEPTNPRANFLGDQVASSNWFDEPSSVLVVVKITSFTVIWTALNTKVPFHAENTLGRSFMRCYHSCCHHADQTV